MNCDLWQQNEPRGIHFPAATLLDNGCVVVHWAKGKYFELKYKIVVCNFNSTAMVWSPLTLALTGELELGVLVSTASEAEGWETRTPQEHCFS